MHEAITGIEPFYNQLPGLRFDGATFNQARDGERLTSQLQDVIAVMAAGSWWTLAMLAKETRHPEASISARIRDLKKPTICARLGRYFRVESDPPEAGGTWHYRLLPVSTPMHPIEDAMTDSANPSTAAAEAQATPVAEERTRRRNVVSVSIPEKAKALALLLGQEEEALVAEAVAAHVERLEAAVRAALPVKAA